MVHSYEKKNSYDDVDLDLFKSRDFLRWTILHSTKSSRLLTKNLTSLIILQTLNLVNCKTDVSDYDNLFELYEKDFQLFLDYNIQDTELIEKLRSENETDGNRIRSCLFLKGQL